MLTRPSSVKLGRLLMIGKPLRQNDVQSTSRYAHLARDSVKAAGEMISGSLAVDMVSAPDGGGLDRVAERSGLRYKCRARADSVRSCENAARVV